MAQALELTFKDRNTFSIYLRVENSLWELPLHKLTLH